MSEEYQAPQETDQKVVLSADADDQVLEECK